MRQFILLIAILSSTISKAQIIGNWYFNKNQDLFITDTVEAFSSYPIPKDTMSVIKLDSNNYFEYCPLYFVNLAVDVGVISIYCSKIQFSDSKYFYYNDTLQLIFHNTYFPLTGAEIRKLNRKQLKKHYYNFGISKILYFKTILTTKEKLILVRINEP